MSQGFHFGDEAAAPTPAASSAERLQPRVLLVEPRREVFRPLLAELGEAGVDCRFAVDAASAPVAAREAVPHLVVFGAPPGTDSQNATIALRRIANAPLLMLCHEPEERTMWGRFPVDAAGWLMASAGTASLVHDIEAALEKACGGQVMFVPEKAAARMAPPRGWGVCRDCGYMGPQLKFADPNRTAVHSLRCPACLHSDHIEFAIG